MGGQKITLDRVLSHRDPLFLALQLIKILAGHMHRHTCVFKPTQRAEPIVSHVASSSVVQLVTDCTTRPRFWASWVVSLHRTFYPFVFLCHLLKSLSFKSILEGMNIFVYTWCLLQNEYSKWFFYFFKTWAWKGGSWFLFVCLFYLPQLISWCNDCNVLWFCCRSTLM